MEVYAGMVDGLDQSIGRLLDGLAELGELDNTIVVFTSDNGASREGEEAGTSGYFVHLLGQPDVDADLPRMDLLGGPQTMPHYPRGWAMASNTPFRLYKINTHAGGHSVPFVLSWPERLAARGELRRQYAHVTDLLPTLLDLTGVEAPTERHGRPLIPMAGTTFAATLADAEHPSTRTEQVYEMVGHRGFYRDGWEVVTRHVPMTPIDDAEWELYDLTTDPTELRDLAAEHPEKVAELAAAWEAAAHAEQIYPLDEGSNLKFVQRPERSLVFSEPVTIYPGTPTLERWRSLELINMRDFTVTASVDLAEGDRGWLVAHGDQGGGYGLYVDDGRLWWLHNDGKGVGATAGRRPGRDRRRPTGRGRQRPGRLHLGRDPDRRRHGTGLGHRLPHAVPDVAVRGHRRGHGPALPRVLGDLRGRRALPLHRQAAPRPLRARRARPRLRLALEGRAQGDGRQVRVARRPQPGRST